MDYAQLKLDDPGGDLESAFATLSVVSEPVSLNEYSITIKTIAGDYGMALADSIYAKIKVNLPEWVQEAISPNGTGLDICNSITQAEINAITPAIFTTEERDAMFSFATEDRLKYPSLKPGDVEYARTL